jgi:membrane-bound lytic murein transglycosylase B
MRHRWLAAVCLAWTAGIAADVPEPGAEVDAAFEAWLEELRTEARARNVSDTTLERALAGVRPIERVIELDRKQPESEMTFARYLDIVLTDERIEQGRQKLAQHRSLLADLQRRYGVQPRYLVALWGVESTYGTRTGSFEVIPALATLAYEGRRGAFFRGELLDALDILDQGHVEPARMLGSWAGAMGQPQFMPSSFKRFAVDHDGDARSDIWDSTADALASAANYLARHGWRGDQVWGREAKLPAGFDPGLVGRNVKRPLGDWQRLGVRRANGTDLPPASLAASVVQPGGSDGPSYLVYENFHVLLRWNRSDYFATSVGLLADRIGGR